MGDSRPFEVRFWEKVSPEPNTGCWLWNGFYNGDYGAIQVGKKQLRAHRAAWLLLRGPIPAGLQVCHHCDNPACVNVEGHLFLGTAKENQQDCKAKGRLGKRGMRVGDWAKHPGKQPRGERNGQAILTAEMVVAMREAYADCYSVGQVARQFGYAHSTVWSVVCGLNWRHVGGPIALFSRESTRARRSTAGQTPGA